ncbi:kelch-like protein 3 [Saccostrea cucullata]|uniref:kelch-like protein 3 n=1 Tax=Saccostrea cuccullata TaxID=36930 RepID=UPI002ED08D55
MATECKLDFESEDSSQSTEIEAQSEPPKTAFPPTDVILEVEGVDLHLNKQVLIDNSPVFKAMFESDFSEKYKERVPLPEKKYSDFVNFLCTFYNPECLAPITEKNVLEVASLADEYQIMDLKEKCESFILENCKRTNEEKGYCIQSETLVNYAACAEKHNMVLALPLIMNLCSKKPSESLKRGGIERKVSTESQRKIWDIRLTFAEQEISSILDNGEENILKLMELAWEDQHEDKMEKCENRLVAICRQCKDDTCEMIGTFTRKTLLDYIIAAEKYELKNLLSSAIELASKYSSYNLKNEEKYNKISSLTKYKIDTQRLSLLESNYGYHISYSNKLS